MEHLDSHDQSENPENPHSFSPETPEESSTDNHENPGLSTGINLTKLFGIGIGVLVALIAALLVVFLIRPASTPEDTTAPSSTLSHSDDPTPAEPPAQETHTEEAQVSASAGTRQEHILGSEFYAEYSTYFLNQAIESVHITQDIKDAASHDTNTPWEKVRSDVYFACTSNLKKLKEIPDATITARGLDEFVTSVYEGCRFWEPFELRENLSDGEKVAIADDSVVAEEDLYDYFSTHSDYYSQPILEHILSMPDNSNGTYIDQPAADQINAGLLDTPDVWVENLRDKNFIAKLFALQPDDLPLSNMVVEPGTQLKDWQDNLGYRSHIEIFSMTVVPSMPQHYAIDAYIVYDPPKSDSSALPTASDLAIRFDVDFSAQQPLTKVKAISMLPGAAPYFDFVNNTLKDTTFFKIEI